MATKDDAKLSRRLSITGGVVKPGQPSIGTHASGFPVYQDLPDRLDETSHDYQEHVATFFPDIDLSELRMPTSMTFSEEGIYDNLPSQKDNLQSPSKMAFSDEGAYETLPMRGEEDYAKGQTKVKSGKHKSLFDDPVVHESEVRRAFLQGRVLDDPDRGQRCKKCSTCPGFEEHYWRKVCKWCRCSRIQHQPGTGVQTLDLDKAVVSQDESMAKIFQKYAWVPNGVDPETVEEYFRLLPKQCVPLKGSKGEEWRRQQLHLQNPPYDTDWELCDQLTRHELEWFKKFDKLRMREAFDIGDVVRCPDLSRPEACAECFLKQDGTHWPYCSKFVAPSDEVMRPREPDTVSLSSRRSAKGTALTNPDDMPDIKTMKRRKRSAVPAPQPPAEEKGDKPKASGILCRGCSLPLKIGEVVVQIGRLEPEERSLFHPMCVICSQCGELLVDLRCFVDIGWEERGQPGAEERLFCGRHWADNRRPRCSACDETIHQPKQVYELNTTWHFRHFACFICDANLTEASTYVPRDGKPLCMDCYTQHIADKCVACGRAIDASRGGGGKISVQDKHWHPRCFVCKMCKVPLKGKPCVPKGSRVYCKNCYKQVAKSRP